MQDLLNQIRAANRANLFYVALMSALALPDMCGALESVDGIATGQRFADWFDQNVGQSYRGMLTGQDCYRFRCALLHQGRMQHPNFAFTRILFIEPTATSNVYHRNVILDALNIDVRIFVEDVVSAVEQWLPGAQATSGFRANYAQFVSRHPSGLAPYIQGAAVIA